MHWPEEQWRAVKYEMWRGRGISADCLTVGGIFPSECCGAKIPANIPPLNLASISFLIQRRSLTRAKVGISEFEAVKAWGGSVSVFWSVAGDQFPGANRATKYLVAVFPLSLAAIFPFTLMRRRSASKAAPLFK